MVTLFQAFKKNFFYKPVIRRQARDKVWPNMQPVWSHRKEKGEYCSVLVSGIKSWFSLV